MKNTLLNKKAVAVVVGSLMSMSAISFSTGIVVAGATMIIPTIAQAKQKAVVKKKVKKLNKIQKNIRKNKQAKQNGKNSQIDTVKVDHGDYELEIKGTGKSGVKHNNGTSENNSGSSEYHPPTWE